MHEVGCNTTEEMMSEACFMKWRTEQASEMEKLSAAYTDAVDGNDTMLEQHGKMVALMKEKDIQLKKLQVMLSVANAQHDRQIVDLHRQFGDEAIALNKAISKLHTTK